MRYALLLTLLLSGCNCVVKQVVKVQTVTPVEYTDRSVVTASYEVELK